MSEGVWEIDAESRTTFVNARMEDILHQPRGSMLGRSMFDFLPEDAVDQAEDNVSRRRRGISEHHDSPLRRSDGETVWTTMATTPMRNSDGAYVGALAIVTDVTQARAIERRLAEAQKLEGLELLGAGVAHDFNNVLGVILAHTQLAARRAPDGGDVTKSLAHIEEAVRCAMGLTRRLRAYAGASTGESVPVDVTALVDGIAKVLARTLPSGVALEPSTTLASSAACTLVSTRTRTRGMARWSWSTLTVVPPESLGSMRMVPSTPFTSIHRPPDAAHHRSDGVTGPIGRGTAGISE